MSFLIPFLLCLLAGMSTMLGSLPIFLPIKEKNLSFFLACSLAFCAFIMIGISVGELIPEACAYMIVDFPGLHGLILSILMFLLASVLMHILDSKFLDSTNLYHLGLLSMIVLMIHNLPEGMITYLTSYEDLQLGLHISLAIMFHNIPEGVSIALPIYYATKNRKKAIFYTFLSGIAEPLGGILAYFILQPILSHGYMGCILLFVAGLMATLAFHHILPKSLSYHKKMPVVLGILLGLFFFALSIVLS